MDRDVNTLTDEELIQLYVDDSDQATYYRDRAGRVGLILQQRMEERGATAIPDEHYEVRLKEGSPTWDYGILGQLREIIPPDELAKGYTPEHEQTVMVPESWNMTKIKPLAKYGNDVATIIERARIPGRARLSIQPKGE